jgi:hypothetical protein
MLSPHIKVEEVGAAALPLLKADQDREACRAKLRSGKYAAVVRTHDHSIWIPIVKFEDGRFARSMPVNLTRLGFKPGTKVSREKLILETGQMILRSAALAGRTDTVFIVDRSEELRRVDQNRIRAKLATQSNAAGRVDFIDPKALTTEFNFAAVPQFLRRIPGITPGEQLAYAWMIFRACADGVYRNGFRALAREIPVSENGCGPIVRSLRNRGLIDFADRGTREKKDVRFPHHPAMDAEKAAQQRWAENRGSKQQSWADGRNSDGQNVQQSGAHKEENAKTAALSDNEWLENVVAPQFKGWSLGPLLKEWREHGLKGQRTRKWRPGDRAHFVRAWMPKAGAPPAMRERRERVVDVEPEWWTDFVFDCYPDAKVRDFAEVFESYPDIVAEGWRWAQANGRAK